MTGIPMKDIKLVHSTGVASVYPRDFTVHTWEEADKLLRDRAFMDPDHGLVEKTDFVITFEDGNTHSGTVETRPMEVTSLAGHIQANAFLILGDDPKFDDWRKWVDPEGKRKAAYVEQYSAYEYPFDVPGVSNESGVSPGMPG